MHLVGFFTVRIVLWCTDPRTSHNYYSGYKHIICTLNLNLMFFSIPFIFTFYTLIFFRTWKKNFKINYYSTRLTHDFWSTSTSVKLQTVLCANGSCYGLLKQTQTHTHIHSSELKYTAALDQNQFWHHSPFIVHNYGVIYATKIS